MYKHSSVGTFKDVSSLIIIIILYIVLVTISIMRIPAVIVAALVLFSGNCVAAGVVGTAEGFAHSTTGGGSATPQYPANIAELKSWLTDNVARVIVLNKE